MLELIGRHFATLCWFVDTLLIPFDRPERNQHWRYRRDGRQDDGRTNSQAGVWIEMSAGGLELLCYAHLLLEGSYALLLHSNDVRNLFVRYGQVLTFVGLVYGRESSSFGHR